MKYTNSITDFFKSPKWMMNLLLSGLCSFIPIVGPMVVFGWLISGFWGRRDPAPETFPDFDFANFGKWLERGLWPMLVMLVAGLGMYLFFLIPVFVVSAVTGAAFFGAQGRTNPGLMGGLGMLLILGLELVLVLMMIFILKPLLLRACLVQDFVKAFDFGFVKRFVSLTWVELLLSALFVGIASWILAILGMLALCVGILLLPGLIYYMIVHLDQQIYRLYLSRGGEPIPLSPKLAAEV